MIYRSRPVPQFWAGVPRFHSRSSYQNISRLANIGFTNLVAFNKLTILLCRFQSVMVPLLTRKQQSRGKKWHLSLIRILSFLHLGFKFYYSDKRSNSYLHLKGEAWLRVQVWSTESDFFLNPLTALSWCLIGQSIPIFELILLVKTSDEF